jgi:hydrogenase maturation protease
MMNILVIGVGNEFRGDDAAGVLVARQLMAQDLPGTTVLVQSGEGTDLMTAWEGAETVFVIDAVQSGAVPGTIHRFEAHEKPLPADFFCLSSHVFGVAEAIEISRRLGQLPERTVVYGIEGANFATGPAVSQPVETASQTVAQRLLDEIQTLS